MPVRIKEIGGGETEIVIFIIYFKGNVGGSGLWGIRGYEDIRRVALKAEQVSNRDSGGIRITDKEGQSGDRQTGEPADNRCCCLG